MNVALVGYGRWGGNHARLLHSLGLLTAIVDADPESMVKAAEDYQSVMVAPFILDVYDMCDAMVIATPIMTHDDLVEKGLKMEKHILVEKPLSTDPERAAYNIAIAKDLNLVLATGYTFLHDSSIQDLKFIIAQLGEVRSVTMQRTQIDQGDESVGVVYDLMSHDIAILFYLFDDPIVVTRVNGTLGRKGAPDSVIAELKIGSAGVQVWAGWGLSEKVRRIKVSGANGWASWEMGKGTSYTISDASGYLPPVSEEPLARELTDFSLACHHRDRVDMNRRTRFSLAVTSVLSEIAEAL